MSQISIVVEDPGSEIQEGTLGGGGLLRPRAPVEIETGVLKASFSRLAGQISEIFQDVKNVGDFQLRQVQLSVEISAQGGVSLIGTAKVGTRGAITLTFGL